MVNRPRSWWGQNIKGCLEFADTRYNDWIELSLQRPFFLLAVYKVWAWCVTPFHYYCNRKQGEQIHLITSVITIHLNSHTIEYLLNLTYLGELVFLWCRNHLHKIFFNQWKWFTRQFKILPASIYARIIRVWNHQVKCYCRNILNPQKC